MNHISIKMDPKGNNPETNAITRRCLYQGCSGTNPGIAWTRQGHDALGLHNSNNIIINNSTINNNKKEWSANNFLSPANNRSGNQRKIVYLMCLPNNVPPMVKGTATNNHNKTNEIAAVVGMEWEP